MTWFPIHTHALPRPMAQDLCGAVVAAETDPARLRTVFPPGRGQELSGGASRRLLCALERLSADWAWPCRPIFTIERLPPGGLPPLGRLRGMGVVMAQPYHPHAPNAYIDPLRGLTRAGILLLRGMADAGLAVDLSHLSGPLLRHVAAHAPGARIVSHAVCADLLRPGVTARANAMTREDLLACDAQLYGVPFLDDLLSFRDSERPEERDADIGTLARHIRRMAETVGVERTALGPDLLCQEDYAALRVRPVRGMDTAGGLRRLRRLLRCHGMAEADVNAIFAGNAQRVLGGR